MTEACQAVLRQVKKERFPFVTATQDIKNPASGKVTRRLGMRYQYSYEELWQPKNKLVVFRLYQLNLDGKKDRIYQAYWDKAAVRFKESGI